MSTTARLIATAAFAACAAAAWAEGLELSAQGCYSLADKTGEVTVKVRGLPDGDLSRLKYCVCDAEGRIVCRYREHPSKKPQKLKVNLPAGKYEIRATDGESFHSCILDSSISQ